MCTVLLPPGGYPIAVNKYIIYHILKPTKQAVMEESSNGLFQILLSEEVFMYTLLRSTRDIQAHSLLFLSVIDFMFIYLYVQL